MQRTPVITVILPAEQAWAFAQFLKRVGLHDYRALAADLDEAWLMREAGEAIRCELRQAGCDPR
jgi:hypothetical protein